MILALSAHPLVHLNAALNALATVLLVFGYLAHQARETPAACADDDGRFWSLVFVSRLAI